MKAVEAFRARALSPEHPQMRGSHENGDIFFQNREACNKYYEAVPGIVEDYMKKINEKLGTNYQLFNYYGAEDADRVIVAMGSICDVTEEVIDYLNAHGEKVGLVKVRLYRPWRADKLLAAIPATCQDDRGPRPHQGARRSGRAPLHGRRDQPRRLRAGTTSPSSAAATASAQQGHSSCQRVRRLRGACQGRSEGASSPSASWTTSPTSPCVRAAAPNTAAEGTIACKFWGLGGDGTVGANKNSIKIIGDHTDKYVQAYFQYDSKKTGGVTISHLRFGDKPIKSPYYINKADFVACHNPSYITKGFKMAQKRQGRRSVPGQQPVEL